MLNMAIKEKMSLYGEESLSNEELFRIILGENASIAFFSNHEYDDIFHMSKMDLIKIEGIGESLADKIIALKALVNNGYRKIAKDSKISSPSDIFNLYSNMSFLNQEILKVVALNTKNYVIGECDVFKGSLDSSIIHPREILKFAIKKSASKIAVIHNHPSGNPEPSKEDINVTVRIKESCKVIGIELIDHIIIGEKKFISLKERGII